MAKYVLDRKGKSVPYLTNKDLLAELAHAKELGHMTDELARMFDMMATRYSYHPWFVGYSFREDMVSAAVASLFENWHKFDPRKTDRPNPFAYFTTAIKRSFLRVMGAELDEIKARNALLAEMGHEQMGFRHDEEE